MLRGILFTTIVWFSTCALADARPAHKLALAQYFGPFLPKKLNDCRTCHLPEPAEKNSDDIEKPHNPFGARIKAARLILKKEGKAPTIEAALERILDEDSDGDGVSNRIEILTGHFPGDKEDRPTALEIANAKSLLVEFAKLKSGYPWRPYDSVTRPAVPTVKNMAWVRNPIDAFIAAEHQALGLTPRPEAPPEVLLRRVYLDLIGLPPTPQEIADFELRIAESKSRELAQQSAINAPRSAMIPDAVWEKVVNRLLDDPRYGERWGRHWMDVWRYSDWAGYGPQVRDSQPHIWHWRDWIIESLNIDKGYDRMVLEMLAGDELAPEDPKALAGTGYLVRNWKLLSREKWIQDTVEHTAMAFLATTLQCAKCHDHMFDPILQKDYYQFRAIFEPHDIRTDRFPGQPDIKIDGLPRVFDKDLAVPTFLFVRGDDRTPDKTKPIAPGVPEALGGTYRLEPMKLPPGAVCPEKRDFVVRESIAASAKQVEAMRHALASVKTQEAAAAAHLLHFLGYSTLANLPSALKSLALMQIRELDLPQAETKHAHLLATIDAERLEDSGQQNTPAWKNAATKALQAQRALAVIEAKRKLLGLRLAAFDAPKKQTPAQREKLLAAAEMELAKAEAELRSPPSTSYAKRAAPVYPSTSTGRRLALARWIASADNPRTARVAVNHIWLRHFGQALVPSVFDFGKNGRPPSHPALLDWLAAEFMHPSREMSAAIPAGPNAGWSMKHLHRLIVTSSTYRTSSTPDAADAALDRDNKYLWRYPPHRLEAEAVRDSIFYVAGKLDPAMSGPDIDYPLGLTVPRRSLYFRHAAEKEMEFLSIFDAANVTECYERKHSIIPQQALALVNSELTLKQARILARAIAAKTNGDASAFTESAFLHVLSRHPTAAESSECVTFLQEQSRRLQTPAGPTGLTPDGTLPAPDPALRARENLVHVLMNHHEFVTMR